MNGGNLTVALIEEVYTNDMCCSTPCDIFNNNMIVDIFDGICAGVGAQYDIVKKVCTHNSPPMPVYPIPSPPPLENESMNSTREIGQSSYDGFSYEDVPWLDWRESWSCNHSLSFTVDENEEETLVYEIHDVRSEFGDVFVIGVNNTPSFVVSISTSEPNTVNLNYKIIKGTPEQEGTETIQSSMCKSNSTLSEECVSSSTLIEFLLAHFEASYPVPNVGNYVRQRDDAVYTIENFYTQDEYSCVNLKSSGLYENDDGSIQSPVEDDSMIRNTSWSECRVMRSSNEYLRIAQMSSVLLQNKTYGVVAELKAGSRDTCMRMPSEYTSVQSVIEHVYGLGWMVESNETSVEINIESERSSRLFLQPWTISAVNTRARSLQAAGPLVEFQPDWVQAQQNIATVRLFGRRYIVRVVARLAKQTPEFQIFARLVSESGNHLNIQLFSRSFPIDGVTGVTIIPPFASTLFSMPQITLFSFGPLALTFKPSLSAVAALHLQLAPDKFQPSLDLYLQASAEIMLWTPCFLIFKAGLGIVLNTRMLNNKIAVAFESETPGVALWNAHRICVVPRYQFLALFLNVAVQCRYCTGWRCRRCRNCLQSLLSSLSVNLFFGASSEVIGNPTCGIVDDSDGPDETWLSPPPPPPLPMPPLYPIGCKGANTLVPTGDDSGQNTLDSLENLPDC